MQAAAGPLPSHFAHHHMWKEADDITQEEMSEGESNKLDLLEGFFPTLSLSLL